MYPTTACHAKNDNRKLNTIASSATKKFGIEYQGFLLRFCTHRNEFNCVFRSTKLRKYALRSLIWSYEKYIRMGINIFKIFIWGGILSDIRSEITFYSSHRDASNKYPKHMLDWTNKKFRPLILIPNLNNTLIKILTCQDSTTNEPLHTCPSLILASNSLLLKMKQEDNSLYIVLCKNKLNALPKYSFASEIN